MVRGESQMVRVRNFATGDIYHHGLLYNMNSCSQQFLPNTLDTPVFILLGGVPWEAERPARNCNGNPGFTYLRGLN